MREISLQFDKCLLCFLYIFRICYKNSFSIENFELSYVFQGLKNIYSFFHRSHTK